MSVSSTKKLTSLIMMAIVFAITGIIILYYKHPSIRSVSLDNLVSLIGTVMLISGGIFLGVFLARKYNRILPESIFATSTITQQAPDSVEEFSVWQKTVMTELEKHAKQLEEKSQLLATRMASFQEWNEYPAPLDLNQPETRCHLEAERSLRDKDHVVSRIIEETSRELFEKLKTNYYSINGKFNWQLVRGDAYDLARSVAQVYRPEVDQPLLETNTELILRATGRMSFHFLIVLEQLPLDVKTYNINTLYETVRKSVQAYGFYKKASPYLGYLTKGINIGRMATATNPVVAGIWWGATELGKIGVEQALKHVVNQQIVSFLQDMVRVVGYEVAAIYGGDFRYRDSNWICAVELIEMLSSFPLSRESLSYGLQEIGRFPLRNEYDRIYLYRCIANHHGSGWKQPTYDILSQEERTLIAEQLEKSWRTVLHGKTSERTEKWRKEVESRLGVRLKLEMHSHGLLHAQMRYNAIIESLAFWVLNHKPIDYSELEGIIKTTRVSQHISESDLRSLLEIVQMKELTLPDYPDLDPNDPVLEEYFNDLVGLMIRIPVYHIQLESELKSLGSYYRKTESQMQKLIESSMREQLATLQPKEFAPQIQRLNADQLRSLFSAGLGYQTLKFVYLSIQPENSQLAKDLKNASLILAGDSDSIHVIESGEEPRILWSARKAVSVEKIPGYLSDSCRLTGGEWEPMFHVSKSNEAPRWVIQGIMTEKFDRHFSSLLQWNEQIKNDQQTYSPS